MESRYVLVQEDEGVCLHNTGGGNINFIAYEAFVSGYDRDITHHKVVIGYSGMDKPRVQTFNTKVEANNFINKLTENAEVITL